MADLTGTAIGFIGLGHMGKPMARHLHAAGARVTITSRSRGPVDELAAEGLAAVDTPRDVTEASETVILMVTNSDAVDAVLHGPDGVIAGLAPGRLVIDMGTTKIRETREWAAEVAAAGGDYLDAPVSGGQVGAEQASLTIMVGGDTATLERARPIFETLGQRLTLVGDTGAGQVAKSANQVIAGLTLAAVAEALTMATRAGVDPAKVREALTGGFADSRILELHGKRMIDRAFAPGAHASVQLKDMRQALELADQIGLELPSVMANEKLWQKMVERGWGELDQAGIIRAIEEP